MANKVGIANCLWLVEIDDVDFNVSGLLAGYLLPDVVDPSCSAFS